MTDYVITSRDPRVLEPVREFLRGNGIDPDVVPIHSTITVEDGRVTTDRYVRGEDGKFAIVYGEPVIETVAVDLVVPWPADLVLHPLCVVEEDGVPCPYLAVYDTQRCVPHAEPDESKDRGGYHGRYLTPASSWPTGPAPEPPAPVPARPYSDDAALVQLGAELDDADFAEAHASVRPEMLDQISRVFDVPPRMLASSAKRVPVTAPVRMVATLDEFVEWTQKHGHSLTPEQINVIKIGFGDHLTTTKQSIGARVWRRLRRWAT